MVGDICSCGIHCWCGHKDYFDELGSFIISDNLMEEFAEK